VSTYIGVTSTSYQVENRSWLLSQHGTNPGENPSITIDVSSLTAGTHYPNGYIPSGTVLSKLGSGLWGPFDAVAASGEHGILFSSLKVPNTADTTQDVGGAVVVAGFIDYNKLPAGGKPTAAALRTALPLTNVTTVTP
jgi:hypothetical protein